jgi:hypothetical protein
MSAYHELAEGLRAKGIASHFQNSDQLVVANENPAMPGSNCFWVTNKNDKWYIGTWLPAVYRVPPEQNICHVCETVFRSSPTAIYRSERALAASLKLRRLALKEIEKLGFA